MNHFTTNYTFTVEKIDGETFPQDYFFFCFFHNRDKSFLSKR